MTRQADRRVFLAGMMSLAAVPAGCVTPAAGGKDGDYVVTGLEPSTPGNDVEAYWGDPDTEPEFVEFNPFAVRQLSSTEGKMATVGERIPDFEDKYLATCERFVGFNRADNQPEITRFCNLFKLPFKGANGKATYYCAMGLSYAAALTYFEHYNPGANDPTLTDLRRWLIEVGQYHFYPTPSCRDMQLVAEGTRRWVRASGAPAPRPGWIVLFDWSGKRVNPNHVGIVSSVDSATGALQTIEFNTAVYKGDQRNGGYVARKTRAADKYVMGYIDTAFRNPFA